MYTYMGCRKAYSFSIVSDLEQKIKQLTFFLDRYYYAPDPLDLFFTTNPLFYSLSVSSPRDFSDPCLISFTYSFSPPPPILPTQCHDWHFDRIQRTDMCDFLNDFPEIPVATSVTTLPRWCSGLRSRSVVGSNPAHASTGISGDGLSMLEFHCRVKWFLIVNDLSCCDSHFI